MLENAQKHFSVGHDNWKVHVERGMSASLGTMGGAAEHLEWGERLALNYVDFYK